MKKVKINGTIIKGFDRKTGIPVKETKEEYVCENCRHLVEKLDDCCWQCGNPLEVSNLIETYGEVVENENL